MLDASDSNVIYSSLCSMERDIFHGVLMDKFSERGSGKFIIIKCSLHALHTQGFAQILCHCLGLGRLCQHNFGNNWDFLESSIMPE